MAGRKPLQPEEIAEMRRIEFLPRIIFEAGIRQSLKRRGFIKPAPALRKYKQMPYGLTDAGAAALKEADTPTA